jgi:hypothetical protein
MTNPINKNTNSKTVTKSLKYSVAAKFINFDPIKYAQRVIIVDGKPAIRLKGRVYKLILAKR